MDKRKNAAPITLMDLTPTTCRFPVEYITGIGHTFCGSPIMPNNVYCKPHCDIAYDYTFFKRKYEQLRKERENG